MGGVGPEVQPPRRALPRRRLCLQPWRSRTTVWMAAKVLSKDSVARRIRSDRRDSRDPVGFGEDRSPAPGRARRELDPRRTPRSAKAMANVPTQAENRLSHGFPACRARRARVTKRNYEVAAFGSSGKSVLACADQEARDVFAPGCVGRTAGSAARRSGSKSGIQTSRAASGGCSNTTRTSIPIRTFSAAQFTRFVVNRTRGPPRSRRSRRRRKRRPRHPCLVIDGEARDRRAPGQGRG